MSQFTTEGGSLPAPRQVARAGDIPRVQEVGAPTYKESFLPLQQTVEISSGAKMAAELSQALGLVGHDIQQAGSFNQQIVAAQDRQTALQDRLELKQQSAHDRAMAKQAHDEEVQWRKDQVKDQKQQNILAVADHAAGHKEARMDIAQLHDQIQTKAIPVPQDSESINRMIEGFVKDKSETMTPAKEASYRATFEPDADRLLHGYRVSNLVDSQQAMLKLGTDAAIASKDGKSVGDIIQKTINTGLNMDPETTRAHILTAALHDSAVNGQEDKFRDIQKLMGIEFGQQQTMAEIKLNQKLDGDQKKLNDDYIQRLSSYVLSETDPQSTASGPRVPYSVVAEHARSWGKEMGADPKFVDAQVQHFTNLDKSEGKQMERIKYVQEKQAEKGQILEDAYQSMMNAKSTGGAAHLEDSHISFINDEGQPQTASVTRADKVEYAMKKNWEECQKFPPIVAMEKHIRFMSDNGEPDKSWTRLFKAAAMVPATDLDKMTNADIPTNWKEAYSIAKVLKNTNPALYSAHFSGDKIGEHIFNVALLDEKYVHPGDPIAAGMSALKAAKKDGFGDPQSMALRSQDIKATIQKFAQGRILLGPDGSSGKIQNPNDVGGEVEKVAHLYMESMPINAPDAVAFAVKDVAPHFTIINGWAVQNFGIKQPEHFKEMASIICDQYAKKFGKEEGLESGDLSFTTTASDGQYVMVNKRTNKYVEHYRTDGTFTNTDFVNVLKPISAKRGEQGAQDDAATDSHAASAAGQRTIAPGMVEMKTSMDSYREAIRRQVAGGAITRSAPAKAPADWATYTPPDSSVEPAKDAP